MPPPQRTPRPIRRRLSWRRLPPARGRSFRFRWTCGNAAVTVLAGIAVLLVLQYAQSVFLMVQLFTSAMVGIASWLAFRAIGLGQAAVWGLLARIFNSIPYMGPVLVSGSTAVVAFLQLGTMEMTLVASGAALVITSLEGFLLTPWLTSRAARMNAVAVFVGLLFRGWVWNVWGMLLAVPMLMVVKSICDHVEDFKGVGELLGD